MGVFSKLKDALFEEVVEEVEERPKRSRRSKYEEPVAKKIVTPEVKRVEDQEEEKEERIEPVVTKLTPFDDDDFEPTGTDFKPIDVDDFKEQKVSREEVYSKENNKLVEDSDYDTPPILHAEEMRAKETEEKYMQDLYGSLKNNSEKSRSERPLYEKPRPKSNFKPSPIISPIYGILDKNYKTDELVPKRITPELRSIGRDLSVDEVRAKAFGEEEKDLKTVDIVEGIDDNTIDLSDKEKPTVNKVTLGDAEEYYEDLGLEYNKDYIDGAQEKETKEEVKENKEPKVEEKEEIKITPIIEEDQDDDKPPIVTTLDEEDSVAYSDDDIDEKEEDDDETSNANLFDLIDSMYDNEEE